MGECFGQRGLPDSRRTVFVVEDDADVSEAIADILREEGYAVVCAGNGEEALRYLRDNSAPLVVLLDLFTPVMDGWQFLQEIRKDSQLSMVPVIVMSATGDHTDLPVPAKQLLRKPMDREGLIRRIREVAGGR